MLVRVYLWESLGLGSAGRMTLDTENGRVQLGRLNRRVVGMLSQRTMTGFAIHVDVLAHLLHFQNVCVTGLAGFVAGKMNRTGSHLTYGGPAVVAILSKGLRHNEVPDHQEKYEGYDEQKRKPQQMSCIFKQLHRKIFPSRGDRERCEAVTGPRHT